MVPFLFVHPLCKKMHLSWWNPSHFQTVLMMIARVCPVSSVLSDCTDINVVGTSPYVFQVAEGLGYMVQ